MLVVLAIISAGLLGFIIYLAFSPKSSKLMKRVSFIALGLIILSMGICAIFLIIGSGDDDDGTHLPFIIDAPPAAPPRENIMESLIFSGVFLIIMALIITLAVRDRRRREALLKMAKKKPVLEKPEPLDNFDSNKTESDIEDKDISLDDDDFDLALDLEDDK